MQPVLTYNAQGARISRDSQCAAANYFEQLCVAREFVHEGVDLRFASSELHNEAIRRRIENAASESHNVTPYSVGPFRPNLQLEQNEFALEMLSECHVLDVHHVDELVELIGDLLNDSVRALGDQGEARYGRVVGRGDGQGFNVVAAGGEQACHPGERPGFVLEQDGNDMAHGVRRVIHAPNAGQGLAACGERVAMDGHPGLARSMDCTAQWPAGLRLQGRYYQ